MTANRAVKLETLGDLRRIWVVVSRECLDNVFVLGFCRLFWRQEIVYKLVSIARLFSSASAAMSFAVKYCSSRSTYVVQFS